MKLRRPPTVAVLPLAGVIGVPGRGSGRALTYEAVAPGIERAFRYRRLEAVALSINSPGGSAVQSARIADRIRRLGEEKGVPVLSFVDDVGASGGYWLACAGSEIFVHPASILGSIGVIFAGFGFDGALERLGVERRVHALGERKGMLDPFRPEKPEDVEVLRAMQQDIHDVFIEWVRERRGVRLKEEGNDLFSGRVWTGRQAVELGLADGLGEMRQVVRERFGKRVRLRVALRRRRRFPLLRGAARPRRCGGGTVALVALWPMKRAAKGGPAHALEITASRRRHRSGVLRLEADRGHGPQGQQAREQGAGRAGRGADRPRTRPGKRGLPESGPGLMRTRADADRRGRAAAAP